MNIVPRLKLEKYCSWTLVATLDKSSGHFDKLSKSGRHFLDAAPYMFMLKKGRGLWFYTIVIFFFVIEIKIFRQNIKTSLFAGRWGGGDVKSILYREDERWKKFTE